MPYQRLSEEEKARRKAIRDEARAQRKALIEEAKMQKRARAEANKLAKQAKKEARLAKPEKRIMKSGFIGALLPEQKRTITRAQRQQMKEEKALAKAQKKAQVEANKLARQAKKAARLAKPENLIMKSSFVGALLPQQRRRTNRTVEYFNKRNAKRALQGLPPIIYPSMVPLEIPEAIPSILPPRMGVPLRNNPIEPQRKRRGRPPKYNPPL